MPVLRWLVFPSDRLDLNCQLKAWVLTVSLGHNVLTLLVSFVVDTQGQSFHLLFFTCFWVVFSCTLMRVTWGGASSMGQELYTVFASVQMLLWLLLAGRRRISSQKGIHTSFDPWAFIFHHCLVVDFRWSSGVQATVARQSRNYGISRRVCFFTHLARWQRSKHILARCSRCVERLQWLQSDPEGAYWSLRLQSIYVNVVH